MRTTQVTTQPSDPPPTYNILTHGASAAASNHYNSLDMSPGQRPISDEYLKPDDYDYIVTPEYAATGFKVIYHK